MRFYTFSMYQLSPIQVGIQSAHVIGDMFVKYRAWPTSVESEVLWEWATHHKTMICLGGGGQSNVAAIAGQLIDIGDALSLPTASFFEDESLGYLMTSTGIVVPESIYEKAAGIRQAAIALDPREDPEMQLIDLLNSHSLAR